MAGKGYSVDDHVQLQDTVHAGGSGYRGTPVGVVATDWAPLVKVALDNSVTLDRVDERDLTRA